MEESRYYGLKKQHSGVWRSLRDGDFEEEDVWDVLRGRKDSSSKLSKSFEPSISVPRNLPSASRLIPGAATISNSSHESKVVQQSAPVNIPDWSKIYRKKPKKPSNNTDSWLHDNGNGGDHYYHHDNGNDGGNSDDDEDDDDDDDESEYNYKLPPHEVIDRRFARSQISSFSVFEGVGRTLKGRDLSKVRNAILTKTGFLESL